MLKTTSSTSSSASGSTKTVNLDASETISDGGGGVGVDGTDASEASSVRFYKGQNQQIALLKRASFTPKASSFFCFKR